MLLFQARKYMVASVGDIPSRDFIIYAFIICNNNVIFLTFKYYKSNKHSLNIVFDRNTIPNFNFIFKINYFGNLI